MVLDRARLDRGDEVWPILGRLIDQMDASDGFHMGEHFVDLGDPEANMPRPAHVVRLPGHNLLPAGRMVKDK